VIHLPRLSLATPGGAVLAIQKTNGFGTMACIRTSTSICRAGSSVALSQMQRLELPWPVRAGVRPRPTSLTPTSDRIAARSYITPASVNY